MYFHFFNFISRLTKTQISSLELLVLLMWCFPFTCLKHGKHVCAETNFTLCLFMFNMKWNRYGLNMSY